MGPILSISSRASMRSHTGQGSGPGLDHKLEHHGRAFAEVDDEIAALKKRVAELEAGRKSYE